MCTVVDASVALLSAAGGTATSVAAVEAQRDVAATLARFGESALRYALRSGIRVQLLQDGQRYRDASRALARLSVDVDAWPVPPAGLFVVEERAVLLRCASPMTVAHEFGHALDCALGGGVYRSGYDLEIRTAFAAARRFVTPYAATGLDEYFAESVRAYVEVNDGDSPWAPATRAALAAADATMYRYVERTLASLDRLPIPAGE